MELGIKHYTLCNIVLDYLEAILVVNVCLQAWLLFCVELCFALVVRSPFEWRPRPTKKPSGRAAPQGLRQMVNTTGSSSYGEIDDG
jgi:hypothetical protein